MRTAENSRNEKTSSLRNGVRRAAGIGKQKKRNGSDIWIRNGILKWVMS